MPEPRLGPKKPFDPKDPNPCDSCSYCCEYIAIEIDNPTTVRDFDHIYWFLIHKDVWVYIDEENDWHIQFNTPCEKLNMRRCDNYHHRPIICRDYEPKECSRYADGEDEKYMFKNEVDFFEYMAKKRPKMFAKLKARTNLNFEIPKTKKKKKKEKARA